MSVDNDMRQVLGEMEVYCQYGSTTSLEPSTSSGERTYGRPPGTEHAAHEEWRRRYNEAFNKTKVLEDAIQALVDMRHQKRIEVKPESEAELESRIVSDGVGWSVSDIANHCRCTEKMVRKARTRVGVSIIDGKGVPVLIAAVDEDKRVHARDLADRGMTERQIGMITGLAKTSLRRALGRTA